MTKLHRLHRVLGVLCLAFVGLIVVANTVVHSAPGGFAYFVRGDVAAMLGLATVLAVVLFWASADDTDRHRAIGSIASGTMTGLLLGTVSIPVLAVPLSVLGCFRLPESRAARIALLLLVPLGVVLGVASPYVGRSLIASSGDVPAASTTATTAPAAQTAAPSPVATSSPARPSATAAPGLCSNPRMTTEAVIERYFELSTSKDPRAVSDCFAASWRARFVTRPSWDEVATEWASAGPAAGLRITKSNTVNGCDRYGVAVQMPNRPVAPFFTVGPEGGTPRIFETGTALVNAQIATTTCR